MNGIPDTTRVENLIETMWSAIRDGEPERAVLERIREDYSRLQRADKPLFFDRIQHDLEAAPEDVKPLLTQAESHLDDPDQWPEIMGQLRNALRSPRVKLFRRFIGLPGGLKFLLDLRADAIAAQREGGSDLRPLDSDLVGLFETWFHDGFLSLEEISLDSPFRQIEIIKNRDLVHPMTSLDEMGRRLGKDRRCFALYHRAMHEEPVVFIEVALTHGIVRSVHEIIGPDALTMPTAQPDTAVFYSINNTQNGLAGLGLGKVLVFQVVDFLRREEPAIKTFCTLSPMPGFWRRYLKPLLGDETVGFRMTRQNLSKLFDKKTQSLLRKEYQAQGGGENGDLADILLKVFSNTDWAANKTLVQSLAKPIRQLGYHYLAEEKDPLGRPLDPVANFHMGNGATLSPANVSFGANWSEMGVERSLSLMVNYIYSYDWRRQIKGSMTWLGGLLPGLARRKTDRG
jgi:malonyl-CoA decarboxylase